VAKPGSAARTIAQQIRLIRFMTAPITRCGSQLVIAYLRQAPTALIPTGYGNKHTDYCALCESGNTTVWADPWTSPATENRPQPISQYSLIRWSGRAPTQPAIEADQRCQRRGTPALSWRVNVSHCVN
jgi:hypothetical protein